MLHREDAALAAMQGILAGNEVSVEYAALILGIPVEAYNPLVHWPQYIANRSWAMADALVEQQYKPRYVPPELPVGTDAPPVEPVEGMLMRDKDTGDLKEYWDGKWQQPRFNGGVSNDD